MCNTGKWRSTEFLSFQLPMGTENQQSRDKHVFHSVLLLLKSDIAVLSSCELPDHAQFISFLNYGVYHRAVFVSRGTHQELLPLVFSDPHLHVQFRNEHRTSCSQTINLPAKQHSSGTETPSSLSSISYIFAPDRM